MSEYKKTNITDSKTDDKSGHPVGVGVGAVGTGAAAGAAGGLIAGPVGAVVGAVAGAVVGGLAGKAAAESINPTIEAKYWRENYSSRPYAHSVMGYEEYAPAYQYGWENFKQTDGPDSTFETIEAEGLLERATQVGERFRARFTELKETCPLITDVRIMGAMIGVQLATEGAPIVQKCLSRGLLINCTHGNVIRLLPAINIPDELIDEGCDILAEVLLAHTV